MSSPDPRPPRALVVGCAGPLLDEAERRFLAEADPLGLVLFGRNCQTPEQVRTLIKDWRAAVGRPDAPVLIDQEGGRVQRLRPPHWPDFPAARTIGRLAEADFAAGREAAWITGRLIAHQLHALGITVDYAPVADVPVDGAHDVIGDRAFARDPRLVADLARATAEGLMAGGVLPVIKHMPGHGRALADSHAELPRVAAARAELEGSDFLAFAHLNDFPLGMVAHVVLEAIDAAAPASTSAIVIRDIVRGPSIGFQGVLFSDDLSMGALSGGVGERAKAVLAAGCDVAVHCNGDAAEMAELAAVVPALTPEAWRLWRLAEASRAVAGDIVVDELVARLDLLFERALA